MTWPYTTGPGSGRQKPGLILRPSSSVTDRNPRQIPGTTIAGKKWRNPGRGREFPSSAAWCELASSCPPSTRHDSAESASRSSNIITGHGVFLLPSSAEIHFPPGGQYFFSQSNTSLCQYSLFFGLRTQWPSSGKFTNRLGTP